MPPKRVSRSSTSSSVTPKKPNVDSDLDDIFVLVEACTPSKDGSNVDDSNSEDSSDNESSSSGEDFEFQSLAKHRSRRAVAGNRMNQLLAEAKAKMKNTLTEEEQEVYKDFVDVENDNDFEAEDRLKSDSEVDSDFDEDEPDEEPDDVGETELRAEKRTDKAAKSDQQRKKREKMMKELATNLMVEDNVVDNRTHAKYLAEAKQVAIKNKADLLRIEEQLTRRREEDLATFRPIVRQRRTDVYSLQIKAHKDGSLTKRFVAPANRIPKHKPKKLWLARQHLMPPKPPGFDDIPAEIVGFGF